MERLSNYLIEKLVLNDKTKIRKHKHRYTQEDFKELKDFNEFFNADFDDELISIHLGEAVDHENNGLCCWSFIEYWDEDFSGYENDPDCFLIFNDEQFDFFIEEYKPETNMRMYNYEAPQWLYDKLFDIGLDNSFGQSFYLYIVKLDDFLDNEIIKGVAKVEKFKRAIKKVKDKLK
jgi:hypothetical protein